VKLERFAFSTSAYMRHSWQHALTHIATAGFKGAEILADKPHVWLDSFAASDQIRLVRQLDKVGLFVSNLNANCTSGFWSDASSEPCFDPSLVSRRRELREWRVAYSKKALRVGKAVGARNVSITSGRALSVPPEKAQKLLLDGLNRLIDYAEKLEQPFSLELKPLLLIETAEDLARLIAKFGSPYFGATLNVCDFPSNPTASISKLKDRLFHVQLADCRRHEHFPRIPGEGDLHFQGIFKALNGAGYTGPLTWNLPSNDEDPDAACRKAWRYTKALAKS
jgi:sugar phosphate isomerase/epimerase